MKFLKRNQVIIFVIGLMLVSAGYLNYTTNSDTVLTSKLADSEEMASIGDATLVSTDPVEEENIKEEKTVQENVLEEEKSEAANTVETNTIAEDKDEYFTKSKLERDTMYSQMLDTYQKILEKDNVSNTQKGIAQTKITEINEQKNAIMIAENLIKLKGIKDLVIFVNDKSVNIIVKADKLTKEQVAQIQHIITRELKANISNVHISNK